MCVRVRRFFYEEECDHLISLVDEVLKIGKADDPKKAISVAARDPSLYGINEGKAKKFDQTAKFNWKKVREITLQVRSTSIVCMHRIFKVNGSCLQSTTTKIPMAKALFMDLTIYFQALQVKSNILWLSCFVWPESE